MIPDGTSIGVVSAARWYKIYNELGNRLHIDPFLCGTVKTYSSNSPIGDSAPTAACYMTGVPQQAGNISIYPLADPENDLVYVDPNRAYQPLATILEAGKIEQNRATGLVVTCEFSHATPAGCAAHHYNRGNYKALTLQMAHQNLDVVFGGGNKYVSDEMKQHFDSKNITYIKNDIDSFRQFERGKVWALFAESELPYDLDRDAQKVPSIEEMTRKAIELLSQDENGFFLMVEGSLVDWAAHANDAVGCITEFIAFDNAVGAAIEFAKKDGNTTVVVLPDHGNSGFSIGKSGLKYDTASLEKLFGAVSKYKVTADELEKIVLKEKAENIRSVLKEYTDIDITDTEYNDILNSQNYHVENYMKVGESKNLKSVLVEIMNARTYFGFTSGGHTGEDVFLAAYHPKGNIPLGMNTNIEINHYLFDAMGLKTSLNELTDQIFAKHTDVFAGLNHTIKEINGSMELEVKKGCKILRIPAYSSVAYLNGEVFDLGSITVYIDKNNTFYLPTHLAEKLQ